MKSHLSLMLILLFVLELISPITPVRASGLAAGSENLLAQKRGGGSGGNRPSGANRTANTSRPANRSSMNMNRERSGTNRVDRTQVQNRPNNVNRAEAGNRVNNVDRNQVNNRVNNVDRRNINVDNDRNYSNRVNRNTVNNVNNVNVNRNVVVNPRGYNSWGWHGGSPWYPNRTYWGGGFWGPFAAGAVVGGITGSLITAAANQNNNTVIVVQQGTPGYNLLDSYGLKQTNRCDETVVIIYGPENSIICATPNTIVRAGRYDIDAEKLILIER
jgi:hypothetical protein